MYTILHNKNSIPVASAPIFTSNGIIWKSNHFIKWQHKYVRHYIYIQFHFPSGGNSDVTFFIEIIHFLLHDDCWCLTFDLTLFIVDNLWKLTIAKSLLYVRWCIFLNWKHLLSDEIVAVTKSWIERRGPSNTFTWILYDDWNFQMDPSKH